METVLRSFVGYGGAVLVASSLTLLVLSLVYFWRQRFYLSPTSIFLAYSALAIPGSFLVSYLIGMPSVFFASPDQVRGDLVSAGLLGMALGLIGLFLGGAIASSLPRLRSARRELRGGRVPLLLGVAAAVALVSFFDLLRALGGLARVVAELGAVRAGELTGKGIQVYSITMLLPTVLQWNLVYRLRSGHRSKRLALLMCMASSLLGAAFGFRAPAVALLVQCIAIWYLHTKTPGRKALLVGMALVLPAVTLLGVARLFANTAAVDALSVAHPLTVVSFLFDTTVTRVRGIEAFSLMKAYVDVHGFGFFIGNISETLRSVIPAALVEKPLSLTEKIATDVYGQYLFEAGILRDVYGGVSYTFISEGYWNLGFLGILLYGLFFGGVFALVERAERASSPSNTQLILYKACAGFTPLLVEAPQLGVNAVVVNVVFNALIVAALTVDVRANRKVLAQHAGLSTLSRG